MIVFPYPPAGSPNWFYTWFREFTALFNVQQNVVLEAFAVAAMPAAADHKHELKYCTNEAGGEVPVFSDGTNWRRVTDRAVMS